MKINNLIILGIIATLLFTACNSSNDNFNSENKDSIRLDSIKKSKIIEDEKKVIGDIKFGIQEQEFNKQLAFFLKNSSVKNKKYKYIDEYSIGDFNFSNANGYFHEKKLYSFEIIGELIYWEDYDIKLIEQLDKLKSVLTSKYGIAEENIGIIPRYRIEKGYLYLNYRWIIGTKTIDIRTTEQGLHYKILLQIYQPTVSEKIATEIENRDKEIADKAKDVF